MTDKNEQENKPPEQEGPTGPPEESPPAEASPGRKDEPAGTPPRRGWGRLLLRVGAGFAILLVVLLAVARLAAPGIARSQGEKFLSDLLQTEVTIGKVRLSVLGRSATVEDFRIASPEGFEEGDLLRLDRLYASVGLFSLTSSRPHIREVVVEGLRLQLETREDGERSLALLLAQVDETLEQWEAEEEGRDEDHDDAEEDGEEEEKPPAGLRLSRLHLADIQLHVRDAYAWREPLATSFALGDLELLNLMLPDDMEERSGEVTELRIESLRITGTGRYRHPLFLEIPEFQLAVELERLMQTLPQPDIRVANLEKHGMRLYLEYFESEDGEPGQNINEFVHLLLNAVSEGPPARLGEEREAPEEVLVADAPGETGEEPAPTEEPAPEDAEAGEEEPWGSLALATLLFDDMEIESGEVNAPEEDRMRLREGRIEVTEFTLPHEPGGAGSLLVRFVPAGPESLAQLTASGGLGDSTFQERTEYQLEVSEFGLVGLPNVRSGILNADFEGTIAEARLDSRLRFRLRRFDLEEKSRATRALVEALRILDTTNAPPISVPIRFNLPSEESAGESWGAFFERLIESILGSIGSPIGRALEEAGRGVEELEEGLEELGRGIGEGARIVEGGVREVEGVLDDARGAIGREGERAGEAVRDAEGAIRGLFGRRSQDTEDDEEEGENP